MQNGHSSQVHETVAEIKTAAKEQALKVRGASATSLLRAARDQLQTARALEGSGELREALSALTKAASLTSMFMETSEFKVEMQPGKKGVLTKSFLEFQQTDGPEMIDSMGRVETKLLEMEKAAARETESDNADGPILKPGGSIAERMRKLQNAGLDASPASKRISRDLHLPSLPSPPVMSIPSAPSSSIPSTPISSASQPLSPDVAKPLRTPLQTLMSPLVPTSNHTSPVPSSSTSPSAHTLIPASSFGPPSPTSSTSSSPRLSSRLSLSDFSQAFPAIDELDEMDALKLPSAPPLSAIRTGSSKHSDHVGENDSPTNYSPSVFSKHFPALPIDPGPRPSSTPIPNLDVFNSRPSSPAPRSPLGPAVPRKPSNLSLNSGQRSPLIPHTTPPEKRELPTALFPGDLYEYRAKHNFKILILDVRSRQEFETEHIKADAVVCIEPSVLLRSDVSAESLENSVAVGPRHELMLFHNRDKFDLIAIHDESSESISDSPALTALVRAIYEQSFRKMLRNMPLILVGGLHAWKAKFGPGELIRGNSESAPETPSPSSGLLGMSPLPNHVASPRPNGPPLPSNAPLAPLPSPSMHPLPSIPPVLSHSRSPAESSTSTILTSPLMESTNFAVRNGPLSPTLHEPHAYRTWIPPPTATPVPPDSIPFALRPGFGGKELASPPPVNHLVRRPAMGNRPPSNSLSYTPSFTDTAMTHRTSPSLANGHSGIQYPQFNRTISPQISGSAFNSSSANVSLPPQASINPSPLSRRRSDYIDQGQEALSVINSRPIDYPELSSHTILRPPPVAASSTMERQDNRPRMAPPPLAPKPPMIQSDYPVTYWPDIQIGTSGLKNLGNTCYMNSTIQCLSATVPFARFFTDGRWKSAVNMVNSMGTKGAMAQAFAAIIRDMWQGEMPTLNPMTFRRTVCSFAKQFSGSEQHDSQEFLSVLLDGLHEDLNRVLHKPTIEMTPDKEAELEKLPTQLASEQQWQMYRMRDDSLVVDFFQGQYRSRLECLTCHKTSTTYNTFMYLTLPIPTKGSHKVTLQQCLDAFVKEEVMEKSDAWNCPSCKTLRKATKLLSLSRLPPVLLIHLKRFSVKGHFTEKIETMVDFPLKGLDLTNYMPPPLPPGVVSGHTMSMDDPRAQMPPYRYDLYGVTNHFGTLSSGHYTAFISSRGGWLYCDDSRITSAEPKDVVGKPAYILFYKRTRA